MTKRKNKNIKYLGNASPSKPTTTPASTAVKSTASTVGQTGAWQSSFQRYTCHKGNTKLYTYPGGGSLYIGGWANGAVYNYNTYVIDLTGLEHKFSDAPTAYDETGQKFLQFVAKPYAGWLSLPFPDYKVPTNIYNRQQWEGIADTIRGILSEGKDVLVACQGGHGRSGLFVSIVCYILAIREDATWASPVEKVRQMHCDEAIETYAQEKYVYDILGLKLTARQVFDDDVYYYGRAGNTPNYVDKFKVCPICGCESLFVDDYGMCKTCHDKYDLFAPVRDDLTLKDIEHKGEIDHSCTSERCMGIWKASKCGHTVHDQIIYDGLCEVCYKKYEDMEAYGKIADAQVEQNAQFQEECAVCGGISTSSMTRGVCYPCASDLLKANVVTPVHNSITDPYKFIQHPHCEDHNMCVGIIQADQCLHIVHNREVDNGLCPSCYAIAHPKEEVVQ